MPSTSPDVLVAGAGIIGGSIAWRLAQAGMRVTLVDAGTMGGEASWAGAGMLAPGGEMETPDVWSDMGVESLRLYPAFVKELEQASGVSIDYQPCGAAEIAQDDDQWRMLQRRAAAQRSMGIPSAPIPWRELRSRVEGLAGEPAGVMFYSEDSLVNPRDITQALRVACQAAGVELLEGWRALSVKSSGNSVLIGNGSETVECGAVVLAAGAWTGEIAVSGEGMPSSLPPTLPVRGHLIGYDLRAGSIPVLVRAGHTYLLQRRNGFTIAGTSSETVGFDRQMDPQIAAEVAQRAAGLLPGLQGGSYVTWIGFRPATPTGLPEIRRIPGSRVWLSYGHYRNGILLAPVTARMVSEQIISSSETVRTLPSVRR